MWLPGPGKQQGHIVGDLRDLRLTNCRYAYCMV